MQSARAFLLAERAGAEGGPAGTLGRLPGAHRRGNRLRRPLPKLRVRDIEMFCMEAGAGDPLVLVMGFGGDHLAWGLQIPVFAGKYRVIAFDNRGVGQTDAPDQPYSTAMMADDTVGLMDAL